MNAPMTRRAGRFGWLTRSRAAVLVVSAVLVLFPVIRRVAESSRATRVFRW